MTTTAIPTQRTVTREVHHAVVARLNAEIERLRIHADGLTTELAAATHAATHDPLTGLLNRAGLEGWWSAGSHPSWSIALLDLDGFKQVNDTYGHAAGDEVLRQVGIRIDQLGAPAARLGGDEFVVLLTDQVQITSLALMLDAPVLLDEGLEVYPTAAIGVAPAGEDLADTLHRADMAMYAAKREGRKAGTSTVVAYDPAVHGIPQREDRPAQRRRDAQRPATRADVWQVQLPDYGDLPGSVCGDAGQAARDRIELAHAPVIRMGGAA